MTIKIAGLEVTVTPRQIWLRGKVDETPIDINVLHQIFSGEHTTVDITIGELQFSAKL